MLPGKQVSYRTGFTEKIIMEVLEKKHSTEIKTCCFMLESYEETPIFIPVGIMEDVV